MTSVDELEGKSGNDLVTLEQLTATQERSGELNDEELVEFYTNEENFVRTTHQVAFSRIIKCRTSDELVDYYLQKED